MGIATTLLTEGDDTADGASFTTASVSPGANRLILVAIGYSGTNPAPTATLSGLGLTWSLVDQTTPGNRQVQLFRAVTGGSAPAPGAITFTSSGGNWTALGWTVREFDGVDLANPIVQSIDGRPTSTTSVSVPFTTTPDPANGAFALILNAGTSGHVPSPGSGWTGTGKALVTPSSGYLAEHAVSNSPSAITGTWTTAANGFVVGAEIKAATLSQGTASGAWAFSGAATGKRTPRATGSGAWSFAGAATGKRVAKGSSSGGFAFSGAATGKRAPKGTAGGSWGFSGSAIGKRVPNGTAGGSWGFSGSAIGKRTPKGSASGVFAYIGAAVGGQPIPQGSSSGSWGFAGSAVGKRTPKGTAVGTLDFTGTAQGFRRPLGTASGSWGFTGRVAGPPSADPEVWTGELWLPTSAKTWDGSAWVDARVAIVG